MSLVDTTTGEVLSQEDYLEALASRVRAEYRRSKEAMGEAVDAYFAIGTCLMEARAALPDNQSFGAWLRAQEFEFNRQWAHVLRLAAEHEPAVRLALSSQLDNGRANIEKAVKQVTAGTGGTRGTRPNLSVIQGHDADAPAPAVFSSIVIDPPWQYDNVATRGAAEDHYPTMSLDELEGLEPPSDDDAHLYLWTTNGFLRPAFDLMDVWGFTYKTTLTWCKPQIGMGNYFRNNSEHVLFGMKGRLPTQRNDIGTWFSADRTKHSAKPESFYDLVEASSPGPWLEMFARRRRMGWFTWGNEA